MSGLIWVQTVCKGYQQTALGGKELYMLAQQSSGARSLVFCVNHHLHPYFVCVGSDDWLGCVDAQAQMSFSCLSMILMLWLKNKFSDPYRTEHKYILF